MKYSWDRFLNVNKAELAGIVVCINEIRQILILRRSDIDERKGQWTLPGGHIDNDDKTIEAGACRELAEEAGLHCEESHLQYLGEPKPDKYYFLATKWTGDVNVDIPNPESGEIEHDDYVWATIEDIKDIDNTEIPIYLLEKALKLAGYDKDEEIKSDKG